MTSAARISFVLDAKSADPASADAVVLVGTQAVLEKVTGHVKSTLLLAPEAATYPYGGVVSSMVAKAKPGNSGAAATSHVSHPTISGAFVPLSVCVLPAEVTRNNHPMSPQILTEKLSGVLGSGRVAVFILGATPSNFGCLASAAGKALPPAYSRKSKTDQGATAKDLDVSVCLLDENATPLFGAGDAAGAALLASAQAVADGARLTARLVDMPPAELTTTAYAEECRKIQNELGDAVTFEEIVGEDLNARGYGGIYGVGKAAECPPRLIIMTYTPPQPEGDMETVALVGKGIVYDTGGLSLKATLGMCSMKFDMGGSAGVLGGFYAACKLGLKNKKITLLLCVAENAIGPKAVRNDDILHMYSGKTVEVNNTDAEGRLVLGDGVAHATKHIEGLDLVLNMCTLTGAQLITTGKKHAGILSNKLEGEQRLVAAGMASGDFCFPMLYCPELLKKEFSSKVADLKNSVKDRGNAQSSCAGHFVESHLASDYKGTWMHVDMAGPSKNDERSTGFGPGLIMALLGAPGF